MMDTLRSAPYICNGGDLSLIPRLGRSPGEGKDYPLQYSGLEKSMGSQRVGHNWVAFTFTELSSPPENPKWLKARLPCLHLVHEITLASKPNLPSSWCEPGWLCILLPGPFFWSQLFDTLWYPSLTLPFPFLTHMCYSSLHFWPISHCALLSK